MVLFYHLIISAYGFWLPNDPRGSWSDFVWAYELQRFGEATTVTGKRSYAKDPHDAALRRNAKQALKYPCVRFDGRHREVIAEGFLDAVREFNYAILAACIAYDHVHLIVGRHTRTIEQISTHLKAKASMALRRRGCHPLERYRRGDQFPTPWAKGEWSVFISEVEHAKSAVRYVENHPQKEGLPDQHWDFVKPATL